MKPVCNFTSEELASINIAKEKLIEITPSLRHLQRLAAAEKRIENKLEVLGCRRAKLSPLHGNGCKPRGTSPTMNLHMCKLLDELSEIEEEINITKHKINKVRNAIDVMPTAKYRDILLKKYITKEKTTQRDWNLRYCFLNAAYLEFFTEYFRLLKNF